MTRPKRMICACCGSGCLGRQWWNRDTGYGLCKKCIPFILDREGDEQLKLGYGIRGIHFDITEDVPDPEPTLKGAFANDEKDDWPGAD